MTKNQMVDAANLINGINADNTNVKRVKKANGLVERENKTIITEDNKQILFG